MDEYYQKMRRREITEEQMLNEFHRYIDENIENESHSKGVKLLDTLLHETEYWLASLIKN